MKFVWQISSPLRMVQIWTGYWPQSDRVTDTQGCCVFRPANACLCMRSHVRKAIEKIQKSVKELFSLLFFIFLHKPLVSLRLLMEIHNTRVLSMRMGKIFLFLISINSSTCYAHRGIKYHFPTFSIFFWIQRKHSKYYRIGTPFSNRLIERGLQAATKIFPNQNLN